MARGWLAWVAGGLLGCAFLPGPTGFLAWGAFVPLLVLLEARQREVRSLGQVFRTGYAFGFAFFLIGIHWIALLSDVAITVPWLKYPAWLAAAAYLALFPAIACALAVWLARRSGRTLAATFPPAYLAVEALRASGELGFPWFQPGYTQHAYLPILQMASLGSVTLVTGWVLVVNVLLWRALVPAPGGGRRRAALGAALALALPWAWGMRALEAPPPPRQPPVAVALVQANVAGEVKWSGQHQPEILRDVLDLSEAATRQTPRPDLIVWPETATGSYLMRQLDQRLALAAFVARTGIPVFSGFADYRLDSLGHTRYFNAAGLFTRDGAASPIYAKRHLVPFGERMPFQRWLPWLGRLDLGQAEWTPGAAETLFPSPAGPFTCLICFEAIFPDLAREDVRRGARWLVNITNDEWFGNSAALYQHAGMAVFRAVENHVPLARCANTGLTILVDASGRIVRRAPVFTPVSIVGPLPPAGRPTPYTRIGDWPAWLALLAVGSLALGRSRGGDAGGAR